MKSSKFKVQSSKLKINKYSWLKPIVLLFVLGVLFVLAKNLYFSAFFQKKDRINIIVDEGGQAAYYSLGLDHDINYNVSFYPDLQLVVPGGYGRYRTGALAKLVNLEKKPDLYAKTYSYALSNFVDFYFYPNASNRTANPQSEKINIYFGGEKENFSLPGFHLLFFGKSNANVFDRLFIFFQLLGKTQGQFKEIDLTTETKENRAVVFLNNNFLKKTQGNFYKKTYREEESHVQILYTESYSTAKAIGQIIEGEGIRVADLTKATSADKICQVTEDSDNFSQSAKSISTFFHCKLMRGNTAAYDIIVKLGGVEKEWEIE